MAMNHWLNDGGVQLRMAVFFALLALMLLLERLAPRRHSPALSRLRWPANFGLLLTGVLLLRLLPLAAIGAALLARQHGWGLFNLIALPPWLTVVACWLLLDLAIYWQHRATHVVPLLWRLHRVHHSDIEFDVTTAVRFHPVEIWLSMLWKIGVVLALGAPPLAVLLFETALNGLALFNHANFRLPGDRWLRALLVTPDMHRVHHAQYRAEIDSNYGNVLSVWDRLFRSYTAQPRDGHETMQIGLGEWRGENEQKIAALLLQPFRRG
ncbi:MAG: sterol desaturase family protein [Stenotrophobium sp.]